MKPGVAVFPTLPFPSGKAVECFRLSAPEPELCPLAYAGMDCRKVDGGVRGAERGREK